MHIYVGPDLAGSSSSMAACMAKQYPEEFQSAKTNTCRLLLLRAWMSAHADVRLAQLSVVGGVCGAACACRLQGTECARLDPSDDSFGLPFWPTRKRAMPPLSAPRVNTRACDT